MLYTNNAFRGPVVSVYRVQLTAHFADLLLQLYTNNVVCPWIALPGGWLESCSDMESCSGITHNILFIDRFQENFRFLLDGHLPVRRPQYLPEGGQLALRHPPPGGQLPAAPFDFTSPSGTVTLSLPPRRPPPWEVAVRVRSGLCAPTFWAGIACAVGQLREPIRVWELRLR